MNKEQIKTSIIQQILIIAPDLEYDDIPSDENLQNALEIDSYDFLHLLTAFLYETLPLKKGIVFHWFYGFLFHNTFITVTS